MCHLTNGVDEITTVEVFETVLIWIVCIGMVVEVMSQGILNPILIMSILWSHQNMWDIKYKGLMRYSSSLNIKGVMDRPVLVQLPA